MALASRTIVPGEAVEMGQSFGAIRPAARSTRSVRSSRSCLIPSAISSPLGGFSIVLASARMSSSTSSTLRPSGADRIKRSTTSAFSDRPRRPARALSAATTSSGTFRMCNVAMALDASTLLSLGFALTRFRRWRLADQGTSGPKHPSSMRSQPSSTSTSARPWTRTVDDCTGDPRVGPSASRSGHRHLPAVDSRSPGRRCSPSRDALPFNRSSNAEASPRSCGNSSPVCSQRTAASA